MMELSYTRARDKKVVLVKLDDAPLENIFLMYYSSRNNMDSMDSEQMHKLMCDLSGWLEIDNFDELNAVALFKKEKDFYDKMFYTDAVKFFKMKVGFAIVQLLAYCCSLLNFAKIIRIWKRLRKTL